MVHQLQITGIPHERHFESESLALNLDRATEKTATLHGLRKVWRQTDPLDESILGLRDAIRQNNYKLEDAVDDVEKILDRHSNRLTIAAGLAQLRTPESFTNVETVDNQAFVVSGVVKAIDYSQATLKLSTYHGPVKVSYAEVIPANETYGVMVKPQVLLGLDSGDVHQTIEWNGYELTL